MKRWRIASIFLTAFLTIVACGPAQFSSQLPDSFKLKAGDTIEFVPIENVTGKVLEPAADQIFNEYMVELLKERKLLHATSQPAALLLKTKLTEYEAGSAVGRWILPGLGVTACAVDAELIEKTTGSLIGRMKSRQTVTGGGFYSIGADLYICKRAADDLMDEIDKKLAVRRDQ